MAVLEPAEVDRHAVDSALVAARDPSLAKFDSILRAQQAKPGTRSTYLWQLVRLKRSLDDPKRTLSELTEAELLTAMAKVADKALANGYQTFAISVRRFYSSLGREDLVKKIRIPRRPSKLPEILSEKEVKLLIEKAPGPEGSLRNRLIVELLGKRVVGLGNSAHSESKMFNLTSIQESFTYPAKLEKGGFEFSQANPI